MLAQCLTVIAGDGHDCVLAIDRAEETGHLRIGVCELAVVGLRVRCGRRVRSVGIVEMHPDEERPPIGLLQPRQRAIDDDTAAALGLHR